MKRHENLYASVAAFVTAAAFVAFAIGVSTALKPFADDEATSYIFFRMIPLVLYAIAAVFAIIGGYSVLNDIAIENGEEIEADITGITEYFVGNTTEIVHYNLFCEAVINKRKYKFSKKNIEENPKDKYRDGKVPVKINPKNPMQYYINI